MNTGEIMRLVVYTDGGSRGNPGPAAFAIVVTDGNGKVVKEFARYVGRTTNNEAEYQGALAGLKEAEALGADEVEVVMDSEVVVKQVNGQYACRAPNLQPFLQEVRRAMKGFQRASFRNVRREDAFVSRADRLLNEELDIMAQLTPRGKPNA